MAKTKTKSADNPLTEGFCLQSPLFVKNEDGTLKKTDGKYHITSDQRPVTLGSYNAEPYKTGMWISGNNTPYPPSRSYAIGDKVIIGNLQDATILEEVEDGVYRVGYFFVENNYGHPYVSYNISHWRWYRLMPICERAKFSFTVRDNLSLASYARSVESLISLYYSGLNMYPKYQRDYVWSREDKEKLLDSIFAGVSIGTFAIARVNNEDEIVDGKQRLMTLVAFYEGRFAYKGVFYENLTFKDQGTFKNTVASCTELTTNSQNDAITLFVRMNTAGKPVDEEIIENAKKHFNK